MEIHVKVNLALSSEMAGFWKRKQGSFFFIRNKNCFSNTVWDRILLTRKSWCRMWKNWPFSWEVGTGHGCQPGKIGHTFLLLTHMTQEATVCVLFLSTWRWTHMQNSRGKKQLEVWRTYVEALSTGLLILLNTAFSLEVAAWSRESNYVKHSQENLPSWKAWSQT